MKEYRVGYDKLNFLLVNLKKDMYTKYWYEEEKGISKFYVNFYDYLLSQVEYFVTGQIYTDRDIEYVLSVKKYVESFVTDSIYKDYVQYEKRFNNMFRTFLKDLLLLLLKMNLTEREGVVLITPTLPVEMIKDWEKKDIVDKDDFKVLYSGETVRKYMDKFNKGELDLEEYYLGFSKMFYSDMPDTVVLEDLESFLKSSDSGKREVAVRLIIYYDIIEGNITGILDERS